MDSNTFSVIPTIILDNKNLSNNEKILYARISSLSNKYGYCFANNEYFAKQENTTTRTIQNWLKKLKEENLISIELKYKDDSKEVEQRIIKLNFDFNGVVKNFSRGGERNFVDNNISINNNSYYNNNYYREKQKTSCRNSRFIKPTISEIKEYISEKNYNVNANSFYDHYEANGWMVGKNKMKDWKAAVRYWNTNANKYQNNCVKFEKKVNNEPTYKDLYISSEELNHRCEIINFEKLGSVEDYENIIRLSYKDEIEKIDTYEKYLEWYEIINKKREKGNE